MQMIKEQTAAAALNLELPGGVYSPGESRELLMKWLADQENFFKIKNLALDMRYGYQNDDIWDKVHALQGAQQTIEEVVSDADMGGMNIRIKSTIEIELCEEPNDTGL